MRRIINIPKRGIGAASLAKVSAYAEVNSLNFYQALERAREIPGLGRAAGKMEPFVDLIASLRELAALGGVSAVLEEVLEQTGYVRELEAEDTPEAQARIENIDELMNKAISYEQENEEPTLSGFLEEVALVADIDSLAEDQNYVVLMTLHSAKGLEFPNVYLSGMEDGLFPSYMSITSDDAEAELEEERRLCYVGITRAKEHLTITGARMRMQRGETQYHKISRFVKEIPEEVLSAVPGSRSPGIPS